MKVAASSGGIGDIIYAIPIMRELGVTDLYVKESYYHVPYGNMYLAVKALIEMQGINCHPTSGSYQPQYFDPAIKVDVNLDRALKQPKRGLNHIMLSYANEFGSSNKTPWTKPWLTVDGPKINEEYTLIAMTGRWRDGSALRWDKVVENIEGRIYFIGFDHEFKAFSAGHFAKGAWFNHWPTRDMLQVARLIRDCKSLYCNQTAALTIAQGLGKDYYLEVKPGKTNTLTKTPNEHILRVTR